MMLGHYAHRRRFTTAGVQCSCGARFWHRRHAVFVGLADWLFDVLARLGR